jgi:hypothetical protein
MKLWIDDYRIPPDETWHWVRNFKDAIFELYFNKVEEVSFDFDLGEEKNGADILEFAIRQNKLPPIVHFHTQNPVGRKTMETILSHYRNGTDHWLSEEMFQEKEVVPEPELEICVNEMPNWQVVLLVIVIAILGTVLSFFFVRC